MNGSLVPASASRLRGSRHGFRFFGEARPRAFFHRVTARRGWGRAIFAVAHKILVVAYCILRNGLPYQDLGSDYLDRDIPMPRPGAKGPFTTLPALTEAKLARYTARAKPNSPAG